MRSAIIMLKANGRKPTEKIIGPFTNSASVLAVVSKMTFE